ncbi:MAG: TrkA family potassium uptake protein [Firmicutes bacterium]|nr:TrkA family potassium uptake protein [Bacillota bacterium]
MSQFAVIGLGRFGASVATNLVRMGHEVLAIDSNEARVREMADQVTHAVEANANDEEALKALGIRNFDVVIVSIGQDIQASIWCCLILKELGVKYIVAKAINELHGKVLQKVGADRVVFPERDMGARVAHNLVAANLLDYIELAPGFSIVEVVAKPEFYGKSLRDLGFRAKYGIIITAIKRGKKVLIAPGADDVIQEGDVLVAIGEDRQLEKMEHSLDE